MEGRKFFPPRPLLDDEIGLFEQSQMLRDRLPGHRQPFDAGQK